MKTKTVLRLISLSMLIIAIVFLCVALTHPELGTVFYIGTWKIGASVWRAFYLAYAIVTLVLFTASFFVKNRGKDI